MKRLPLVVAVLLAALYAGGEYTRAPDPGAVAPEAGGAADAVLQAAWQNRQSDLQVRGEGEVVKILPDDTHGSRHQRFIVRTASGQTVLVAHNIDLAERVAGLEAGDRIAFNGEYEWNEKGGVIHWTHRDPQGRHAGGWLKHGGRLYE